MADAVFLDTRVPLGWCLSASAAGHCEPSCEALVPDSLRGVARNGADPRRFATRWQHFRLVSCLVDVAVRETHWRLARRHPRGGVKWPWLKVNMARTV